MGCWYYKTRGTRVCRNHWEPSLSALDDVVLSAIEEDILAPNVVKASIARAIDIHTTDQTRESDEGDQIAREIAKVDRELERLTALAAAGGSDIPTVLEALRTRQERRRLLIAQVPRSPRSRQRGASKRELEAQLRSQFADWRSMLRQDVTEAPVLERLLDGRITVTPRLDQNTPIFDVRIPTSTRALFEGIRGSQAVASPAGFEPALPA